VTRGETEIIGRQRRENDTLDLFPARGMAALLDRDPTMLQLGSALPPGWHWLYFRPLARQSALGDDGHPRRGEFLPFVDLPRRMWAGGRLRLLQPLRLGDEVERVSTIQSFTRKEGRTGPLAFVTVEHRISGPSGLACEEEQVIVYRDAASRNLQAAPEMLKQEPRWSEQFLPSSVALFRFSAITFNGHRIHYDYPHATAREGYPNIVVHAPLLALLLLDAAVRKEPSRSVAEYEYRATSPLYCDEPITLAGEAAGDAGFDLWATDASGRIGMKATASWLAS
jgi:3-methylfumaryl-CoA hydratase